MKISQHKKIKIGIYRQMMKEGSKPENLLRFKADTSKEFVKKIGKPGTLRFSESHRELFLQNVHHEILKLLIKNGIDPDFNSEITAYKGDIRKAMEMMAEIEAVIHVCQEARGCSV